MEVEQHAVASSFQPQLSHSAASVDAARKAQQSRESSGLSSLSDAVSEATAVQALNVFCKKTKALCDESFSSSSSSSSSSSAQPLAICALRYESVLRKVSASGEADSKKQAKQRAALALAKKLLADISPQGPVRPETSAAGTDKRPLLGTAPGATRPKQES